MQEQNKNGAGAVTTPTPTQPMNIGERSLKPKGNIEKDTMKDTKAKTTNIKDALSQFQGLAISAIKKESNPFFKSTYADLTAVIDAVNHGAQYGLSFSQSIDYHHRTITVKQTVTDKGGNTTVNERQEIVKDIYVTTTMYHDVDTAILSCKVPVLMKGAERDDPQKMGSAITYAKRYGLQSLYGLASDDDGNAAANKLIDESDAKKSKNTQF